MAEERILVVCIDRDDDLGRKTGIQGPVIGRDANIKAATRLILKDPEENDSNTMFAAVKKFDEIKKSAAAIEVVTLTGYGKAGFKSDRIVAQQLDAVLEKFPTDGIVLVTDGAEDDQVIPILQGRAKIISKETVIIKQAQAVESTFYTIKEALKDPFIARIAFGIPGLLLLLFGLLGNLSFQVIAFIGGTYFLIKGFGIEEWAIRGFHNITSSISAQRISYPLYLSVIFILGFGGMTAFNKFNGFSSLDIVARSVLTAQSTYLFIVISALLIIAAKSVDLIHLKRAQHLRKMFLYATSTLLAWFILDSATLVVLGRADLNWFLFSVGLSMFILLIAFKLSEIMNVNIKVTRLLVGLSVYANDGRWLGKVENVDRQKQEILFKDNASKKNVSLKRTEFEIANGRILIN